MATYYEFKEMIGAIFGNRSVEDNDDDIIISCRNRRDYEDNRGDEDRTILNTQIEELFSYVSQIKNENIEIKIDNSYETALDLEYRMMIHGEFPIVLNDPTNDIKYTFGIPSIEYCAFLIVTIIDQMNNKQNMYSRIRSLFNLTRYLNFNGEEGDLIDLYSLLPQMARIYTLQIVSNHDISLNQFRQLKTSFVFQFMYRTGYALIEFSDINDMVRQTRGIRNNKNIKQLDMPPLRTYVSDVIDYYKVALSATDPYIQYLSYYHIMEYFYDEIFRKKVIENVREEITSPEFSYKDDKAVYKLADDIRSRFKSNDEEGQGDELESLKCVLMEFVPIEDLQNAIREESPDALEYYKTQKVKFCDADVIPWTDLQGVYTKLAQRIYTVRNSLVHSKSSKNDKRYKPYEDEKELQCEILLVKKIAEMIIINSSHNM